jgi:hypothetical protein
VRDSNETLGARLRSSETVRSDLEKELERGEGVLARIMRIAEAADDARQHAPEPSPEEIELRNAEAMFRRRTTETMAAAQALAQRTRRRAAAA